MLKPALDRGFSAENPYSKHLVSELRFRGPIRETKWVDNQEEEVRQLSGDETIKYMYYVHKNMYDKSIDFKSDLIKVHVISQGLY